MHAALGRFALSPYNYYYLVFRKITYGLDYNDREWFWGKDGETPFRMAEDGPAGIELLEPEVRYLKRRLAPALEAMLALEGPEYQYPYFLAMHGHDISWAHPKESQAIADANAVQKAVRVIHSDLPAYFEKLRKVMRKTNDFAERRAATISRRV
jgi:mannosylglycerate hydrolase